MSVSTANTVARATLCDLERYDGKAELIAGRIIPLMPTGHEPNLVAGEIYVALREYVRTTKRGFAYTDNMGFAVPVLRSGRESFSPDVAYYEGTRPANRMAFVPGAPTFAVEVRSESDYGPKAETEMAEKRQDYFEAGTKIVWDVDLKAECIRKYTSDAPEQPVIFGKGGIADAEPALQGWRVTVEGVFDFA